MRKRISFIALAAIIGFIGCDSMSPEALFLQDQVQTNPFDSNLMKPEPVEQGMDPWMDHWEADSGETDHDPWMSPWMAQNFCKKGHGEWKGPWMVPDSGDIDADPEPDSTSTGGN